MDAAGWHEVASAPQQPEPKAQPATNGAASCKVSGEAAKVLMDRARAFAVEFPRYLDGNGNPNMIHVLKGLGKHAEHCRTVDDLDSAFAELRKRNLGAQAA